MKKWLVETRSKEDRDMITFHCSLEIEEIYSDGSCLIICPEPEDEDNLVEYCEDLGIDVHI